MSSSGHFPRMLAAGACALGILLSAPAPTLAQVVRGTLVDAATGRAVEGGIVRLVEADGAVAAEQLTGRGGRFELEPDAGGRYRLRAERIGYSPRAGELFELGAGEARSVTFDIEENPIPLEGIAVEGRQRCVVRPEEGALAARLWNEARTALEATRLTGEGRFHRFEVTRWRRDLHPRTLAISNEERSVQRGLAENPIRSAPAEELQQEGYVRAQPDGTHLYFAPDAEVLLSDPFLDGHCFTVEEGSGDEEGYIGLRFQPVPGRELPDVEGVLWLDPATSELLHMEIHFTEYPYDVPTRRLGARLEFESLPSGTWIVRRWWIRMPRAALHRSRFGGRAIESHELIGIIEEGGEAALPETAARERSPVVSGQVLDSTWITRDPSGRAEPLGLGGARVALEGTDHATTTDPEGRFVLEGVDPGTYGASFEHPRLDSLALDAPRVELAVGEGESVEDVVLAIPSAFSLLERVCPERDEETGAIVGQVLGPDGSPVPEARVEATWRGFSFPGDNSVGGIYIREDIEGVMVDTDERGRYRICNVPAEEPLRVRARVGEEEGEERTLDVLSGEVRSRPLRIGGDDEGRRR